MPKSRVILLLFPLLVACTQAIRPVPEGGPSLSWEQRQSQLLAFDRWILRGRAALKINDEGHQLNLSWQRAGAFHVLQLSGPLNQGGVLLKREPGRARLVTEDGKQFEGPDAESLLYQVVGWRLPVAGLDYWVRGLPAPGEASDRVFDERNRLQQLKQGDWEIRYLAYQQMEDMELPATLFIKSMNGSQGNQFKGQVELRIALAQWKRVID